MSPPVKKARLLQKTLQFASTPRASGTDSAATAASRQAAEARSGDDASSTLPAKTHYFFDCRPSQSSTPPDSRTTAAAPPSTDKHRTLKAAFDSLPLAEFWISVEKEYPQLYKAAMELLMQFGSTCLCEKTFSALAYIKNKY